MADLPRLTQRAGTAQRALLILTLCLTLGCGQSQRLQPLSADAVILAYGDSLTYGTGADRDESYPAQLARLLDRKVINAGIPGETSAAGLKRLAGELATYRPELVVLCHGGNDILRRRSVAELEDNLGAMVALIREHRADVVMLGVPGRNLAMRSPAAYENVASGFGVPLDAEVVGSIMRNPPLKSDQVHFNAAGYATLARAVKQLIEDSGGLP